jgi:predicted Rdx family selenoprotein
MPPTVNVSIGQQLIDLKKARDGGALAPKEYEQQVRKLIDSVQ